MLAQASCPLKEIQVDVQKPQTSAQKGYGYRWQKARATYLAHNPLCVMCEKDGRVTLATVVDHKIPHKGDQQLFWDSGNWQSLCKRHHDSDKQMLEKSGRERAEFDADGRVKW